ncbi:pentatricopeptide repeat-containing protein At1g66345, mitochondrial [Argentina anserina]|uniref:pentatricopeptide repeat-containing protein At1g66345, mitochondrial n=1 Tax=Argentina anserina TaxID=57926 RepID=UPI0021765A2D|nr:pentatricopeptide repeat-containing protein At1g66345, mitochondrial [Potentilla anserina]XP_050378760.1 pentatricopeptide repeat-containing protein At1g66345, mitochondrial [Potentilla anserina]
MGSLLRRVAHSLVSLKPINPTAQLMHTNSVPNNVVRAICDSFKSGWSWDALTSKFDSVKVDAKLVESVLLELKEPNDAKRALGFFHWVSKRKEFDHGVWSYSITIHILVRAKMVMDARALIESVLKKNDGDSLKFSVVDSLLGSYEVTASNPFVFDLLVQSYAKMRMFETGFDVCCYLRERGMPLSLISYNTLLRVVEKSEGNALVWKIYEHMVEMRSYPNEETVRILIDALCKEGELRKYADMLDRIHGRKCSPSVIVNSSLVFRILEEGRVEEGMVLLKRMLQKNMVLDTIAYSLIVYAKVKIGDLGSALQVYEEMLKRGFRANPFVYTLFIEAHCKAGRIDEARSMMDDMENMDLKAYDESYNFLIEGCAKAGRVEESVSYLKQMMERRFIPRLGAFNELVGKLSEIGDADQANALLTILLDKGFPPNDDTYSLLIDGYMRNGENDEVLKLYYEMESKSLSPGISVFTSLIKSFFQCGKSEEAKTYFRIMKDRSLAPGLSTYETFIANLCKQGNKEQG